MPTPGSQAIRFQLDGRTVEAAAGESILDVALREGIGLPHLCHRPGLRPDGNCRACVVEIEGERTLAPSCCRAPTAEMVVNTASDRSRRSRELVLELLRGESEATLSGDSELATWCGHLGIDGSRFGTRTAASVNHSHPAIHVNLDACIQCTRCVRACREEQVNDVIGYAWRGSAARIVFDVDDALADSRCVACGECVQACPTAALTPASGPQPGQALTPVDSLCPYCGVGCQLTYQVADNRIVRVDGRDGPANHGRLCVKGRYGFDYVSHRQRLLRPLVRRHDRPKRAAMDLDRDNPLRDFREASWEEAMGIAAAGLQRILAEHGRGALAGFGSAKGSNEEAYLFQKLVRTGFGNNNVDHCTRLCHASSVAALLQMIGSGAVSNPFEDALLADVIIVIGANPTENHPVAATFFKNAVRRGTKLIVMDPRRTGLADHADHYLQFMPDTDVAMLNAIMHVIVAEDLVDHAFIADRTEGYDALAERLAAYPPERVADLCGIDAGRLRTVARLYAGAGNAMIFWGMGVSQHVHGTDNARCLIDLALITGQVGRPGTGLHPLRGQNNVQGASDAGLIPMVFPDYRRVDDAAARGAFEARWQCELDGRPGLTVVEIMHAIHDGKIRGMYIMGENPAMSDPNLAHARAALAQLDHLVVQDIFMTETAHYADVVLPASAFPEKTGTFTNTDRRVQLGRQAVAPPGEARQDLDIIIDMAGRLGLDWQYRGARDVFEEMRSVMPSIAGITWRRLQAEGSVTYPCREPGDTSEAVLFRETFPRPGGRAQLLPTDYAAAAELPDDDYPMVLITGRQLEHWHTGAMTRRSAVLDALEPSPVATLNPQQLERLGIQAGQSIRIRSRRGDVTLTARADPGLREMQVFLPFCYHEAAANLLTNEALDPDGKIPEFKYCAVACSAAD